MSNEHNKIFCENLMQKSIKLERELCKYISSGISLGIIDVATMVKLISITNDFNQIAIKLHHIKDGEL
jgi:hypothetical protein